MKRGNKRNNTRKSRNKRSNTRKRRNHTMSGGGMIWEGIKLGLRGVDTIIHFII
jgi:hypothetical protein